MTSIEITLIIIGIFFLLGSFFIQEKLSTGDMEQIASLSEKEINMILEKQLTRADSEIEDKVDIAVEQTYDATRRALEKETNEKIMAISEYSDTVIESVNKAHNEVMFLYSMLNDKHTELTDLVSQVSEISSSLQRNAARNTNLVQETAAPKDTGISSGEKQKKKQKPAGGTPKAPAKQESPKEKSGISRVQAVSSQEPKTDENIEYSNQEILQLYMNGKSEVEIARELGRGLGEVRLVIGLYRGDVVK